MRMDPVLEELRVFTHRQVGYVADGREAAVIIRRMLGIAP